MTEKLIELSKNISRLKDPEGQLSVLVESMEIVAKAFAYPLDLMLDEVALQAIVGDGKSLRFLYPQVLFDSGATFPINSQSIAGKGVIFKHHAFDNKVNKSKHLLFYEMLKTGVRSPLPIQKMATLPMREDEQVVGVVQLSRRAKSHTEAGPDLSKQDVEKVKDVLQLTTQLFSNVIHGKI